MSSDWCSLPRDCPRDRCSDPPQGQLPEQRLMQLALGQPPGLLLRPSSGPATRAAAEAAGPGTAPKPLLGPSSRLPLGPLLRCSLGPAALSCLSSGRCCWRYRCLGAPWGCPQDRCSGTPWDQLSQDRLSSTRCSWAQGCSSSTWCGWPRDQPHWPLQLRKSRRLRNVVESVTSTTCMTELQPYPLVPITEMHYGVKLFNVTILCLS